MFAEFKRRFWLPPRAHGEIIEDRTVSFLELFYDLVYVVVISRAAHTLAGHVSWRSVGEFAAVFGLIWTAWLNGTLYYELHGREEGRTRFYVFVQMLVLALLAVFTGDAAGESGVTFSLVYVAFLLVLSWLWYTVRRRDSDEYMSTTAWYLVGMLTTTAVMAVSAVVPDGPRTVVWGSVVVGWVVTALALNRDPSRPTGLFVAESLAERFALFVIIVLGEVLVGVVDGLAETERNVRSVATGLLGLAIGFAYWWTYFDYVGRRLPTPSPRPRVLWMIAHLPITMSIAAAGAAMVSLIGHAPDPATPAASAWLLSGAVAVALLALVVVMRTLRDYDQIPTLFHPVSGALVVAAVVSLVAGWLTPAPWLLALVLVLTLSGVWVFAVDRWLRLEEPEQP